MQVSLNHYSTSMQALSSYKPSAVKLPDFQKAAQMPYANETVIQEKSEKLFTVLIEHLKSILQDEKSFFQDGETVCIPDLHGDFVHLITTLHRHGVLESDLKLKSGFKYILLGDIYNRGKDSDVIDHWLNKQITNNTEIYRLVGNHEFLFFTRKDDGKPLAITGRNNNPIYIPSNDVEKDISSGYKITEDLLKNISEGSLLAAYAFIDNEYNIPKSYTHSFITNEDLNKLQIQDSKDSFNFVQVLNEKIKQLGKTSYECFMDCKQKAKYDWKEINAPFSNDPIFNIRGKDANGKNTSYLMRITGIANSGKKLITSLLDDIPSGIYQTVGHTMIFHFDLPQGFPEDSPIIISDKDKKAFVQFSDVGIGYYYKDESLERVNIEINGKASKTI